MIKHFENRNIAVADLKAHGFKQIKNGNWVNDICAASIHPTYNGEWVSVSYWEIEGAERYEVNAA